MGIDNIFIIFCAFWTTKLPAIKTSPVGSIIFKDELNNATTTKSLNPIIFLLVNLSNAESKLLDGYLRDKNYALLKNIIDHKKDEFIRANFVDTENEAPENLTADIIEASIPWNFTKKQYKYAEAYQNASVYSIIRALWNTKVEENLPQIDQYAILEYYSEKLAAKESQQNVLVWLWNLIRRLFDKGNEKYECYANEPKCIRTVLDRCSAEELERLKQASDDDDLKQITDFFQNILINDLDLYIEFEEWNNANDVPEALKDITHGLSQAQRRAMEKLRRLELIDKIKDFYRDNIEKAGNSEQEEIEAFFRRMNKTFARCYNPNIKKANRRQEFPQML